MAKVQMALGKMSWI